MVMIPTLFRSERSNMSGYSIAPFRHTASNESILQKKPVSMVTMMYLAVRTRCPSMTFFLRETDSVAILGHGSHVVRPSLRLFASVLE